MKDDSSTDDWPETTCMMCGEECFVYEYDFAAHELWCYCRKCEVETFHPLPRANK